MSDDAPKSRIRRISDYISPVWFVPLVAALIGLWMVIHSYSERGPLITLVSSNADSIEAGTKIRVRNVVMGQVQSIGLSGDASHAIIKARMSNEAAHLLGDKTQFWVVRPRIGRDGISGLSTVLSGAYIQMLPDSSGDETKTSFNILDNPPIAPADAAGLRISLNSSDGNSISVGDPVVYRGYTVGRVEASNFNVHDRLAHYELYIFKRYRSLVTTNTHFWVTSGVGFNITSAGVSMQLGSLETLVNGGITFDVTPGVDPGQQAQNDANYRLFPNQDEAEQGSYSPYIPYVLMVSDSIRGLTVGAPVEYKGVRMGTVVAMPWHITDMAKYHTNGFRIPILIHIEPQRLQPIVTHDDLEKWHQMMDQWQKNGMRASLATASLVTGALYVDMDFVDKDAAKKSLPVLKDFNGVQVFPTTEGGFGQVAGKVSTLLDKINNLNMSGIVNNLDQNLVNSNQVLVQVKQLSQSINSMLSDPATRSISSDVRATLQRLNKTLEGFGPQAPAYNELMATTQQLQQLLRNLQPAVRAVSNKPNSLIFNRSGAGDPEPRAE
ncbi:Intermembrane transport protein PqiB [Halomonadaceae bacterium LMG 33818]|uniref:intermembrane transport protein PqiB n=1 Tax=Cernens ardua TaxID=3402176 RepID=UPI003EDC4778